MENEQKFITLVREFHTVFGHAVRDEWEDDRFFDDLKSRTLRVKLIDEEIKELKDAYALLEDPVEVFDALADITYVAVGASLVHGVVIKPEIPEMNPLFRVEEDMIDLRSAESICKKFSNLAVDFTFARTDEQVKTALENIVSECYKVSGNYGVDLQKVVDEVHRSNMTKLGKDGKPIYDASGKVVKGPGYEEPRIREVLDAQFNAS